MKPEFKYGLLTGAGVCIWIGLEYLLGFHTTRLAVGEYTGFLSNLIPLAALFLLLRAKRAALYDGRLSFASGIGSGVAASFIAALVVYTFLVMYNQFINPGWIDQALEYKVAQLRAAHRPETAIQESIMLTRQANTPMGLVVSIIVSMTLMGGLISFGLTLLLRQLPHRAD